MQTTIYKHTLAKPNGASISKEIVTTAIPVQETAKQYKVLAIQTEELNNPFLMTTHPVSVCREGQIIKKTEIDKLESSWDWAVYSTSDNPQILKDLIFDHLYTKVANLEKKLSEKKQFIEDLHSKLNGT